MLNPGTPFVFDVDGTLLDSNGCFWDGKAQVAKALRLLNPALTDTELSPKIRQFARAYQQTHGASHHIFASMLPMCYRAISQELGLDPTAEGIDLVQAAGETAISWPCAPHPGAIKALQGLRQADFPIGICTRGSDIKYQEEKLDRWGLRDLADHTSIVTHKGPDEIKTVIEALRPGQPVEGVMVGDSLVDDIGSANKLGIQSIWIRMPDIPWLHDTHPGQNPGATWAVDSVADIPALLNIVPEKKISARLR